MSASELHNKRNTILIDLKSILLSSKDGLTERELSREYKVLNGRDIQYTCLGYNSLYDFLTSLANQSVIYQQRRHPNIIVYFAKEDNCTYQLRNLVSGQKDTQVREREHRRFREATSNRYRLQSPTVVSNSPVKVPYYIQFEIKTVLENAKGNALSRQEFKRNYYQLYPKFIDCEKFGYDSIKGLLESLKHFVEVRPCPNDEYTVSLKQLEIQPQEQPPDDQPPKTNECEKLNEVKKEEREIVENLKILIKNFDNNGGLWARLIPIEYKKMFKKELNATSIGYRYPIDLLDDKLGDFVRIKKPEKYGDLLIFSKDSAAAGDNAGGYTNDDSVVEEDEIEEINHINNIKQLTKDIRRLFRRDPANFDRGKLYTMNQFKEMFETKAGWKFNLKIYGCTTFDQLFVKLGDEKLLEFKYDSERKNKFIKYKHEVSEMSQVVPTSTNGSRSQYEVLTKKSSIATSSVNDGGVRLGGKNDGEKAIFMQKFLNEYVFYNESLDTFKLLEDVDLHSECNVIISHIISPFEMSIQISYNINKLELLMDDLENAYLGVGASHYNMSKEYIQIGKYCAAVFPGDKNWHRCKILEIDDKRQLTRVAFIDYGGEAMVSMNELKFLCRRFMNLPQQAIPARLSNVDFLNTAGKRWADKTTDYLLKIVQSKTFKAKFDGAVFGCISCTLHELDSTGRSVYCLNKRIVEDGFATQMKDNSIVSKQIFFFFPLITPFPN